MDQSNQLLGTEHIGKLMQKYAIPCVISLLVGALYNIVDQIFIANREFRSCKKYRILNRGLFTTFFYAYFCQI